MTYFGVDLSKYQQPSAMNGYDFAIFNVEDPYIGAKVNEAYAQGKRWDIYKWCYNNTSGLTMFNTAKRIVDALYRGGRYPEFWLDYEEGGVSPWQIDEWYLACDNAGVATGSGLYIYLYLMNNQGVGFSRDGWLAYYPGSNDGSYWSSMSDTARARGAKIHQYSSTGGTLDKNAVLDDIWYGGFRSPPPQPPPDFKFLHPMEDVVFAYTDEGPSPELRFFESGMLYEFTPYTFRPMPGVAATDVFGAAKVTAAAMYQMIVARWDVAKTFAIPPFSQ